MGKHPYTVCITDKLIHRSPFSYKHNVSGSIILQSIGHGAQEAKRVKMEKGGQSRGRNNLALEDEKEVWKMLELKTE